MNTFDQIKRIDFHSHILPAADHGSDGLETSLSQLALLKKSGVEIAVATPHFYPERHTVSSFIEKRNAAAELLLSNISDSSLRIVLGAETLLCEGMDKMEGIESLCIEGTRAILLEMPTYRWSDELLRTVERIADAGYTVIMAHVDRYPMREVDRLAELGKTVFQLNASAFVGIFPKRKYLQMTDDGLAVAIGSDIHGADAVAARTFKRALDRMGSERAVELMKRSANILGIQ
jgi:protein-tyrosine phosphatase